MISHRHRCIFIEIPKTGSSSVRALLGSPAKPHLNICQVRDEITTHWTRRGRPIHHVLGALYELVPEATRRRIGERQFETYFKFSFVRNPWDRVVSLYHRKEGLQLAKEMSFDDFVEWIRYSSSTCIHPVPHTNQLDWLVGPSGELLVDFVGRFENLASDWAAIATRLGLCTTLPHERRNPTPRKHYTEYYTARSQARIAEKFAVDIEYFGYTFGD